MIPEELRDAPGVLAGPFYPQVEGLDAAQHQEAVVWPRHGAHGVLEEIERFSDGYEMEKIDGLRYVFGDGWGLIRPSNTSPAIRITAEGRTPEAAEHIFEEMKSLTEDII